MQVGCKPRILDANLIGPHRKVGRAEEPLSIGINSANLVCFGLSQTDFNARNSSPGGVTERSLQCPARLQSLGSARGHAHQSKQQYSAGPAQRSNPRQWSVELEQKVQGTPPRYSNRAM